MPVSTEMKQAILETLQELFAGESNESIFCEPPKSSVIYLNADRSHVDCFFHAYDKEAKKHIPYPSCLKGKITNLEVVKLETSDGEVFKLRTTIKNQSQTVVIQSGLKALFSRDVMWTLSNMSLEEFETIYLEAYIPDLSKFTQISDAKKSKLLSCRLYSASGEVLYFEKPKESEVDYAEIGKRAIQNVYDANNT